jgi:hypothetical protein
MEQSDLLANYNKNDLILLDTVNFTDEYPTLLIKSIMTKNDVLAKVLIKYEIRLNIRRKCDNMNAFLFAVQQGNLYIAKKIYKKCGNIEDIGINNHTALSLACRYGHIALVDFLISKNANVNHCTKNNYTPLILAASYGHLEIVKKLIANGACVKMTDNFDSNALIYASKEGYDKMVDYLVNETDIDIYHRDNNFCNALMYAKEFNRAFKCSKNCYKTIIRILLEKDSKNGNGNSSAQNNNDTFLDKIVYSIQDFMVSCNIVVNNNPENPDSNPEQTNNNRDRANRNYENFFDVMY